MTTVSDIDDKIWITSRVRMIAERKALRNQNVSFLAVTYYSVFSAIISIFDKYYTTPYPLDEINLSASIVVLVASLVAAGFRLEARASAFRECYLKLQRLHDEKLPDAEKRKEYWDIMMDFPNHSPKDYSDLLVNHIFIEGKELNMGAKKLDYTVPMWLSFFGRRALYWAMLVVLFVLPVVFLLWPLLPWTAPEAAPHVG